MLATRLRNILRGWEHLKQTGTSRTGNGTYSPHHMQNFQNLEISTHLADCVDEQRIRAFPPIFFVVLSKGRRHRLPQSINGDKFLVLPRRNCCCIVHYIYTRQHERDIGYE